jgi:acetyl esterase
MLKWLLRVFAVFISVALSVFVAAQVSPWPGALIIRYIFDQGSAAASTALEKHVPAGIASSKAIQYDPTNKNALLDVYYPSDLENAQTRPVVVWTHGGGFVSGHRGDVENYLRIISGRGYTTVSIDYDIAPASIYPQPVHQLNLALGYLNANADSLKLGKAGFVLAGDSAGAQISAQTAAAITAPAYAKAVGVVASVQPATIKGTILFCGPYDLSSIRTDGPFGWFIRTVVWSYSGSRNGAEDKAFQMMSVRNHVTRDFPPSFISAGNADPLLPQSRDLADTLTKLAVKVDALFFPETYEPPLGHEYQFNLDNDAGQQALDHMLRFLEKLKT